MKKLQFLFSIKARKNILINGLSEIFNTASIQVAEAFGAHLMSLCSNFISCTLHENTYISFN
jgi:hypothetical protein